MLLCGVVVALVLVFVFVLAVVLVLWTLPEVVGRAVAALDALLS